MSMKERVRFKKLVARVDELEARIKALEAKRGPGRPRKDEKPEVKPPE